MMFNDDGNEYQLYLLYLSIYFLPSLCYRKHPSLKLLLPESLLGGTYSDPYKQYQHEQWQPIVNLPSTLKSVVVTSHNNDFTTTTTTTTKTIIANDNTIYDNDYTSSSSSIASISINQFESNSKVCYIHHEIYVIMCCFELYDDDIYVTYDTTYVCLYMYHHVFIIIYASL